MVLRLALIGHAPTSATRTASFPADDPLDGPGLSRARAASFGIGPSALCLTSPALAARQTAEALRLQPRTDPDLRDGDYGAWAGRPLGEVQRRDPDGVALWLTDPSSAPHGGESLLAVLDRVSAWLDRQDRPGQVVAITHAGVIRAAIVAALKAPPDAFWRIDVRPLSRTVLRRSGGAWTLVSVNQRPGRAPSP